MQKNKFGLVLGGGGARGLAHIGVLKVFEAAGLEIDIVTGTSMGALIGGLYAQTKDARWVEERVRSFLNSEIFKKTGKYYFRQQPSAEPEDLLHQLTREFKKRVVINLAAHRKSLMKGERLRLAVDTLIKTGNIEDTLIPFACSATDLRYAESVDFYDGDIHLAITASAAIPGFIPPIEHNGRILVDGSICNNFPVSAAKKLGAEFLVASNVSLHIDPQVQMENLIDIIIRANTVSSQHIDKLLLKEVDFILCPDTKNIHWSEFEKFEELVEKGIYAAEKFVEQIKQLYKSKYSFSGKMKRIFSGN